MPQGGNNLDRFQVIDLDYIVSITPITVINPMEGNSYRETGATFLIYIKIGQPIPICYHSNTYGLYPIGIVDELEAERTKLIEAWTGKISDE
jgi:hypothetical protein